jgi:cardiolipin synthase
MIDTDALYTMIAVIIALVELLGILTAIHAVMNARTSQGAIAWAISLVTFPWLALVMYAIFGRNKFNGYVLLRSSNDFDRCQPVTLEDYSHRPFHFKLAVRFARLMAPIL